MKKNLSVIVIAVLLLGGCSKNEVANQEPSGALIKAGAAFPGVSGEATRAPYIGDISSNNELVARVLTSRTSGNYTVNGTDGLYANGKMTFGSGAAEYDTEGFEGEALFATNDNKPYYLVGLYPNDNWVGSFTTAATRSFNGSIDVMAAAQQQTTYKETITDGEVPKLTFKHLLTKLDVSVKGKGIASAGKWGKINKIVLTKITGTTIKNNITITLANGSAASTAFSGAESSFPFYGIGSDGAYTDDEFDGAGIDLTTDAKLVAYSLIAPFTNVVGASPTKLTFEIETGTGGPVTTDVSLLDEGYTQGRAYSITFIFDAATNAIESKAEVDPWDDETGPVDVEVY
jgi:hypothetical protein